ncbi:hypothetical protein EVAR_55136_1 [Eumeta japonica]|uniref:Uncharacterized protein n=1 Tax=Eumeta variegata TaxID=151549 RepID=A0A4C1Y8X1_EUMVA|nr:hypothetical protein EVAR_55136_1 [Eumeta japonica]
MEVETSSHRESVKRPLAYRRSRVKRRLRPILGLHTAVPYLAQTIGGFIQTTPTSSASQSKSENKPNKAAATAKNGNNSDEAVIITPSTSSKSCYSRPPPKFL